MSEQTVKEVRAKFTADLSDYRKQVQDAGKISQDLQDRISAIGDAVTNAQNITGAEMQKISRSLASASKQAASLGKQSQSLAADESQLTRAIAEQEGSLNRTEREYNSLQAEAQRLQGIFDTVKSAIGGLNLSGTLTGELQAAREAIASYDNEIAQLRAKITEASSMGYDMFQMDDGAIVSLKEARQQFQELTTAADQANAWFERLSAAAEKVGQANMGYASTAGLKELQTELGSTNGKMEQFTLQAGQTASRLLTYQERLDQTKSKQQQTATATQELTDRIQEMEGVTANTTAPTTLSNIGKSLSGSILSGLKNLAGHLTNVGSKANATNNGLSNMVRQIRNISVVSLGLKVCSSLFGQLRSVISNCVSSSDTLSNQVTVLKNSLSNALAPAISLVVNLLSKVMPYIVGIADAIASLLTNLFGTGWTTVSTGLGSTASSASDAADAVDDVTDATNDAADAQKAYNKQIMGFDEITKLDDNSSSSSGSGGSGGSGSTPSTSTGSGSSGLGSIAGILPEWMKNLASAFSDMFGELKRAWEQEGAAVVASATAALESLKTLATDIGTTFYDVFMAGYGFDWAVSGLNLLRSMLDIVTALATAFDIAWNSNDNGYNLIASIFTMLTNINNLLATIGDSFTAAWSSGVGVSICSNILQIVTNINNIIGNLASSIQRAWENADTGQGIWSGVLNIVDAVLGFINNITASTAEWAAGLDLSPLLQAIEDLLAVIEPIVSDIGDDLTWLYDNVLLPLASWTLEEAIPTILDGIASALAWIEENEGVVSVLKGVAAALAAYTAISTVVSLVSSLAAGIGMLGTVFGGLLAAINPVTAIIAVLVGAFVAVYNWYEPLQDAVDNLIHAFDDFEFSIDGLSSVFSALADVGAEFVNGLIAGVESLWDSAVETVTNLASDIIGSVKEFFGINSPSTVMAEVGGYLVEGMEEGVEDEDPQGFFEGVWSDISGAFDGIDSWFSNAFGDAAEEAKDAWSDSKSTFTTVKDNVVSGFSTLKDNVGDKFSTAMTGAQNAWSGAKTTFTTVKDNVVDGFHALSANVKEMFGTAFSSATNAWSNAKSSFTTASNNVVSGFKSLSSDIKDKFKSAITAAKGLDWKGTGTDVTSGILNGMYNWGNKLKSWASSLLSKAKSALGVASPSKLFRDEVGVYLGLGVAEGLDDSTGDVMDTVQNLASNIAEGLNGIDTGVSLSATTGNLDGALDSFSETVTDSFTALIIDLSGLVKQAADMMPDLSGVAIPDATGSVDALRSTARSYAAAGNTDESWIDAVADRVAQQVSAQNGGQSGGEITITVPVYLDGKLVGQSAVTYINGEARRTGVNPLADYL